VAKFRGTYAAPQAPLSGDSLGKFELAGYGTTSANGYPQASYEGVATENWGATARGAKALFYVTPNTTITQAVALTLDQDKSATFASTVTATSFIGSGSSLTGVVTSVTGTSPVVSSGGTTPAISMPAATTSVSGYLTSTDWNTFNNKGSGTVTSVTGTAPVVSSGGATPAISMAAATSSVNGYLTSTDWTTFNNKGSGTVTSVAALTLGTTGTDLNSTVATGTTTPVITLNVPTASATNRGALSSTDWSTFNSKQTALVSGTNIKTVGGVSLLGSGDVGTIGTGYGGTGLTSFTANGVVYASSTSALATGSALLFDGTNLGIGIAPSAWGANYKALQVGAKGSLSFTAATNTLLLNQGYYSNGTNDISTVSGYQQKLEMGASTGAFVFYSALTSLGGTIAWNQIMQTFPSGGVSIGNTTDPGAGNLRFNTTGSNGIYFGSSSQLNDYETGTWTPVLNFGGATTGITYTIHQGTYTKVGRMVTIQCGIYLSSKGSATGGVTITGLPYTAINAAFGDNSFIVAGLGNFSSITSCVIGYVGANSTTVYLNQQDGATQLTNSNFTNTTYFEFTAVYQSQ